MNKIVIAAIAAAVTIGIVAAITLEQQELDSEKIIQLEDIKEFEEMVETQDTHVPLQTYRFNTECQLLKGVKTNNYPNGEPMQTLNFFNVIEKHSSDYLQWEDILSDEQKRTELFSNGIPIEFVEVFAQSVSKEYSISPELHSIVMLSFDDNGSEIIDQLIEEHDCSF